MGASILIVEDEEPLTTLLRYNLEAEGYEVDAVPRGDEADTRLRETVPDLVVLDWMLPGLSGIELCRRLRTRPQTQSLPIIMLTARGEESERIRGLATGADDYIVKPFSVPELLARIRALLRRASPERVAMVLTIGDLELDREKKRVSRSARPVDLGPTEFRLLEFLMERPGRVFSREQLLDGVWGSDIYIDERTVDVHVGRLRKALNRGHASRSDPHRARRRLFARRPLRQGELKNRASLLAKRIVIAKQSRVGSSESGLLRYARDDGLTRRRTSVAPRGGRLIRHAAVIGAIGRAADRVAAAKEEIGAAGIADRPAAGLFRQLQNGAALADRNDVLDQRRRGFLFDLVGVRERGIAADRRRAPCAARATTSAPCAGAPPRSKRSWRVPDKPRRCTLPITALRVMPPSSPAI